MPKINVRRWNGSLVTALDPEQTTPGDFSRMENFIYDETGLPTVRGGRRKWVPDPTSPSSLDESGTPVTFHSIEFFKKGWVGQQPRSWIVAYAGTQIVKSEQDATWDQIHSGLEGNLTGSWATLRGWLIFASDSSSQRKPLYWDGISSAMKELSGAPDCHLVATHDSRLFCVDKDEPSTLRYSAPFEPNNHEVASDAGFFSVNPGDGGVISAVVPGFGELIVFKDSPGGGATYRVQGGAPYNVVPLSRTIGAVGPNMAKLVGDRDIFFGSRRGLHSFRRTEQFGDLESEFLDFEFSNIWRGLPLFAKQRATSIDDYPHDMWWVFYDTDNDRANDEGLTINYRHQGPRGKPKASWPLQYGVNSGVVYSDDRVGRQYLMTGGTDGYVYLEHMPEANDDGTDFSSKVNLAPIDAEEPMHLKRWGPFWLRYNNWGETNATVTYYGDNRPPSSKDFSLNPMDAPVPFFDKTQGGEFRGIPVIRTQNVFQLREGGTELNLEISLTKGRTTLRGFQLGFEMERRDVSAHRWMTFVKTSDAEIVG